MGFFDFFKDIFNKEKTEEFIEEKIEFSEIENWIKSKKEENKSREKELFDLIQNKIDFFVKDFKDKIEVAKNADISSKKAEERFKLISEKGKDEYIEFAYIFIDNLCSLDKNNLGEFWEKLNKVFVDFDKSSNTNYERATILIGKEMTDIKSTLKSFSKDLMDIFKKNQNVLRSLENIYSVELKLEEVSDLDSEKNKIERLIKELDKEVIGKKEDKNKLSEKIESVKESKKYLDNISLKKEINQLKDNLEKEIFDLRKFIEFKTLANFYHIFEDKMDLVKKYKENFQNEFMKSSGEENLKSLLKGSSLINEDLLNKIEEIKDKQKDILEKESNLDFDETAKMQSQIESIDADLGNLESEKSKNLKRAENLKIVKDNLISSVKAKVEELGGKF